MARDFAAGDLDEAVRFPVACPEALRELFTGAILTELTGTAIEAPTVFAGFDDYWAPALGGTRPATAYATALAEEDRAALREELHSRLPVDDDDGIALSARAWAVRGCSVSSHTRS